MIRRGFTLLEVCMVVFFTGILTTATLMLVISAIAIFDTLTLQAQLKADTGLAAQRIFHLARKGCRIAPDQSSLLLREGGEIRFQDHNLWMGGRPLLKVPIQDFLVIRREGQLHLTFVVLARQRWKGPPVQQRLTYQQSVEGP